MTNQQRVRRARVRNTRTQLEREYDERQAAEVDYFERFQELQKQVKDLDAKVKSERYWRERLQEEAAAGDSLLGP